MGFWRWGREEVLLRKASTIPPAVLGQKSEWGLQARGWSHGDLFWNLILGSRWNGDFNWTIGRYPKLEFYRRVLDTFWMSTCLRWTPPEREGKRSVRWPCIIWEILTQARDDFSWLLYSSDFMIQATMEQCSQAVSRRSSSSCLTYISGHPPQGWSCNQAQYFHHHH